MATTLPILRDLLHEPSLDDGVLSFFDFLAYLRGDQPVKSWAGNYGIELKAWTPQGLDVAGTQSNTLGSVSGEQRDRFVEYARQSRDRFSEAAAASSPERTRELVRKALRM